MKNDTRHEPLARAEAGDRARRNPASKANRTVCAGVRGMKNDTSGEEFGGWY